MNPFDSFTQVLFSPRRFYSRPHRYEEGLFWVGMGIAAGCLMPMNGSAPAVWIMMTLGSLVTVLSVTLYLLARFCGGVSDFETAFSGAALAGMATLGPLALLVQAVAWEPLSADEYHYKQAILLISGVVGSWLLVMLWQNLWLAHAMSWWKAALVLGFFVLACIPAFSLGIWMCIALLLAIGLVMTAARPG